MATIEEIKKLRDVSGAGINAVKEALKESGEDFDAAMKYLRQKGMAKADKRKDNETKNGILGIYVHGNNSVVVVVEVGCETDFAAKSEDMKKFSNDLALHVAAANPEFINEDSITEAKKNELKDEIEEQLAGKPEEIKERMLEGKISKYAQDHVLLKQKLFTDDSKTVEDAINELVAKIGEKVEIRQFTKFEVAQDIKSCSIK